MKHLILQCETLTGAGFLHGFTTRNLMWDASGDVDRLDAPWREALAPSRLATCRQVHGDDLLWVEEGTATAQEEADALATADERTVAVRTADCVPLLIADPRHGLVAAVHAGWKGTFASIAIRAVDGLASRGARPAELLVAMGPSIGRCCFEVSEELASRFEARFGGGARAGRQVDLLHCNRAQLVERGVRERSIEEVGGCTRCQPERFFSYRREGAGAGRQLSFIQGGTLS